MRVTKLKEPVELHGLLHGATHEELEPGLHLVLSAMNVGTGQVLSALHATDPNHRKHFLDQAERYAKDAASFLAKLRAAAFG